jgi:hypothetical protein
MKVWIRGEGAVTLSRRDFVGQGGQGAIYAKGDVAIKIYSDTTRMVPEGKLRELSALADSNVIRPQKVVCDKNGVPIGYTMRYIRDAYSLCQLFPRSFRERSGITSEQVLRLVTAFRTGLENIHKAGVLVVDLNEMNLLVDKTIEHLYFIDVDSYQTAQYPADAIMESIRDRHAPKGVFTELTDWFSFAVVSFQMFVGIHPFKGKHPALKGLDERMQANVSVLNSDVRVPKAAYAFASIPDPMLRWYQAVFEKGERVAPPDATGRSVFVPEIRVLRGSGVVRVETLHAFDARVTGVWAHGGVMVVATEQALWLDGRRVGDGTEALDGVAFCPRVNHAIGVSQRSGSLVLKNLTTQTPMEFGMHGEEVTSYDGRVYFKSGAAIMELTLTCAGNKILAGGKLVAAVLPKATQLFSGVAIQNLLGATYVSVFPRSGVTYQHHIVELDRYRIIDAAFDSGVLMVMGRPREKNRHRFDRLIIRYDAEYQQFDVRVVKDVAQAGLNFVVLDTGVCVSVTEDDRLEIFRARKGAMGVKDVDDDTIGGDIALAKRAGQLLFSRGSGVYSMSLK